MQLNETTIFSTIKILTQSEQHSSIRNEFYRFFKHKKKNKKYFDQYNTIFHFTFEISKKKNWLDEIIQFQELNLDFDIT